MLAPMKSTLRHLALFAAAAALGTAAHATPAPAAKVETGSATLSLDPTLTDATDEGWDFGNLGFYGSAGYTGRSIDTFADTFHFTVGFREEDVQFYATSGNQVRFTGWTLKAADGSLVDSAAGLKLNSVNGGVFDLAAGSYALELDGRFLKAGGRYAGVIAGVNAIPEPAPMALMGAGLAVVGLAARRRARRA